MKKTKTKTDLEFLLELYRDLFIGNMREISKLKTQRDVAIIFALIVAGFFIVMFFI